MDGIFKTKIGQVLEILLCPDFKPKNEAQLNSLLMFLTTESDDGPVLCRQDQLWMTWFEEAVIKWKHFGKVLNPQVSKFMLNVLIWVCEQEKIFNILKRNNLPDLLIAMTSKTSEPVAPQIGDEVVELLSSLMDHQSGLQWVLQSKYWEIIMIKEINFQTQQNSNAIGKFIAKLIISSAAFDDVSCEMVVQTLLRPLIRASNEVTAVDMLMNIAHGYNLFSKVLQDLLEYQITTNNTDIFRLFTDKYELEKCVNNLLSASRNDAFLHDLYKILVVLSFSKMHVEWSHKTEILDFQSKIVDILCNAFNNLPLKNFLNLLNTSIGCWRLLKPEMPPWLTSKSSLNLSMGNQLTCLLAYPATIYVFGTFHSLFDEVDEMDDSRGYYARKLLKFIIPKTIRILLKCRGNSTKNLCLSPGILTLKHLLKTLRQYDHSEGVYLFQFLVLNIKDSIHVMKRRGDLLRSFSNQSEYIALLFECITELIDHFSISWNECMEALYILEYIYDFLSYFDWPTNIVVKGLQLVEMAISKSMSPQMALLIDVDDYSVKPFAPMLRANFNNPDWMIRKSSVSLIGTISKNAIAKYPCSRNLLLKDDFPCLVLKVAIVDRSPHVRVVALRCLQEMIQVKEFCDVLFIEYDILRTTINILRTARDGIVRAEASLLLNFIHQHRRIPEENLMVLYELMSLVAVGDFEVEVRIKSLNFWKNVIDTHLIKRGMIDGAFPAIIFSEKLHKIVNLSSEVIKKILIEVLNQLATNGCLSVFHAALHDDTKPELNKCAGNFISDFVTMLKNYKLNPSDFTLGLDATLPMSPELGIIESDSITTAHFPSSGSLVHMDFPVLDKCSSFLYESHFREFPNNRRTKLEIVTAAVFIKHTYAYFENNMRKKQKWDDLDLLLDELLYENKMDFT